MTIALSLVLVVVASVAFVAWMLVVAMATNIRRADAEIERLQQTLRSVSASRQEVERQFTAYRQAVSGVHKLPKHNWMERF